MGGCCESSNNTKSGNQPKIPQIDKSQIDYINDTSFQNSYLQNETPVNINNRKISDSNLTNEIPIDTQKRDSFITNFFNKNLDSFNEPTGTNGVFIKSQKRKMKISENSINIEMDCVVSVELDKPNAFFNQYNFPLICKPNELRSKEVYVDGQKIDDYNCKVENNSITFDMGKTSNGQSRKIKVIQEYEKRIINYDCESFIFYDKNMYIQFLIYGVDKIQIDDVSLKNFVLDKNLNLAYFEGKISNENLRGFINYSKRTNYKIYKYIPEFAKLENQIISSQSNKNDSIAVLAKYKNVVFTEYGQDISELFKLKLINSGEGVSYPSYNIGLLSKTQTSVESVQLNGKNADYSFNNSLITINNFGIRNNQFAEIFVKYKYMTNLDKSLIRKEHIITPQTKNAYCKIYITIPDNYVVLSSKENFTKSPKNNNVYVFNGISKEEELNEYFEFCYKKGNWDIYKEYTLSSSGAIEQCTLTLDRLYKGGNYKMNNYEIINKNGEFIDDEKNNEYIFNFKNLNTNRTSIGFKLRAENSTSNYQYKERPELITKIPEEDKQFFKSLSNQILQQDKTNIPIYKKLGRWVHEYLEYNINLKGKKYTAKEIYNMKSGVCEHFTLLYNSLLVSQGIQAIKVSGYALDITENNIIKDNKYKMNSISDSSHAWTLAKIDGEWVPLDATWNMFNKNVPITHIFQNYGDGSSRWEYIGNKVDQKVTQEIIKYIKN